MSYVIFKKSVFFMLYFTSITIILFHKTLILLGHDNACVHTVFFTKLCAIFNFHYN